MNRKRALIPFLAAAAVVIPAAPAGANGNGDAESSCVGWFASTFAEEFGAVFGGEISSGAHTDQPFGLNNISPFAHVDRQTCKD
jgi:hypothetical protein